MTTQEPWDDFSLDRGVARGFTRSTETGLLLPDRLAGAHQPSGKEWFQVRGTWYDIYRQTPSWQDVADRLSGFGLGQVLLVLGGVSAVLNSYEPLQGQRRVIQALFRDPDQVGRAIQAYWDRLKPEGVTDLVWFFSEQQVVAIAKIALLACPHVTERSSGSLDPIGEALIMAADLIDREEDMPGPPDFRLPANRNAWLRFIVMNGTFNASDDFACSLARTHDLYLPDYGPAEDDGAVDLRARFQEITGLDPEFAWGMGLALFANWRTVDPNSDRPPGPLSLEAYMSALNISPDEINALTNLFAVDANEAKATLLDRGCGPDSLLPYDLQPLDRSPLVSLQGRLYCPSVRLLRWKLTTGLHHVFLQPSERNDETRRLEYFKYAGRVFENYVGALVRRIFPQEARRYVDEKTLRHRVPTGMKACDGVVLYGDTVLLFECKSTLLPYGVRAEGDLDILRNKVGDVFGKAAEQFDDTILAIEDGCLEDWVRPGNVTRYLPLVVTLDMIPVEPFFYQTIEDVIASRNALSHAKARPLQVLAVSELELLEEHLAQGGSLADLVLERIENGTYRDSTMKNYLLEKGMRHTLRPNRVLRDRFKALGERMIAWMRERAGGPW
ncbi:MAG: hypothetical protein OXU74_06925 [Gemmatimonadota bacterium]|nr:hypothetical protein [Gemmatimonadota bacterium]